MLLAVAVASPGTIRLEKAAVNEKPMAMAIIRYRTPVILAVFLIEFIFHLLFLVDIDEFH
jgi:hypothetical protein